MSEPRTLSCLVAAFSAIACVPDECTAGSDPRFLQARRWHNRGRPVPLPDAPGVRIRGHSSCRCIRKLASSRLPCIIEKVWSPSTRGRFLLSWTALLAASVVTSLGGQAPPVPPATTAPLVSPATSTPPALAAAYASASTLPRLRSLLVSQRGDLVLERYFNGARATTPANIKSASKSVMSALVGIAIDRGPLRGRRPADRRRTSPTGRRAGRRAQARDHHRGPADDALGA